MMKVIALLTCFLVSAFLCDGAEEEISRVSIESSPFATATMNEGVFKFTLKRVWLRKKGGLKPERVLPNQMQVLEKGEEILIYERHTKIVVRNDEDGEVTVVTTFDGRSFGSQVKVKTQILDVVSTKSPSK